MLQVAAFRAGCEEVFPLRHLNAFYEDEIEAMLCGTGAFVRVILLTQAVPASQRSAQGSCCCSSCLSCLLHNHLQSESCTN